MPIAKETFIPTVTLFGFRLPLYIARISLKRQYIFIKIQRLWYLTAVQQYTSVFFTACSTKLPYLDDIMHIKKQWGQSFRTGIIVGGLRLTDNERWEKERNGQIYLQNYLYTQYRSCKVAIMPWHSLPVNQSPSIPSNLINTHSLSLNNANVIKVYVKIVRLRQVYKQLN